MEIKIKMEQKMKLRMKLKSEIKFEIKPKIQCAAKRKKNLLHTAAFVVIAICFFQSCSTYRVYVGVSRDIEERYGEFIMVEVDAVALSDDEDAAVKKDGVDGYFDPQNPLRDRLNPIVNNTRAQSVLLGEDNTKPRIIKLDGSYWTARKKRQDGKAKTILIAANLPPVAGVNTEEDGRILLLPFKKSIFGKDVYIEVDSTKIAIGPKKPKDPNAKTKKGGR
jgi:hypothetical protein